MTCQNCTARINTKQRRRCFNKSELISNFHREVNNDQDDFLYCINYGMILICTNVTTEWDKVLRARKCREISNGAME